MNSFSVKAVMTVWALWTCLAGGPSRAAADASVRLDDAPRRARYLIAREVWSEAAEVLRAYLATNPDDVAARYDLAHTLFRLERDEQALEQVLALPPDHPVFGPGRRDLLTRLQLRAARKVVWDDPASVLRFARLCARMKRYERAIRAYRRLLAAHDTPAWRREYAEVLYRAGRYAESVRAFARYLERQPEDDAAHHALGRVFMAQGNLDAAGEALNAALRFRPDALAPQVDLVRVLIWKDEPAAVERLLDTLVDTHPEAWEPRRLQVEWLLRRERVEAAYDRLVRMLEEKPDDSWAAREYEVLTRSRRVEIARLRRRLDAAPDRIEDHRRLIDILLESERAGAALREMERLSARRPDDEVLRRRIAALREARERQVRERIRQHRSSAEPAGQAFLEWMDRNPQDARARRRFGSPGETPDNGSD